MNCELSPSRPVMDFNLLRNLLNPNSPRPHSKK